LKVRGSIEEHKKRRMKMRLRKGRKKPQQAQNEITTSPAQESPNNATKSQNIHTKKKPNPSARAKKTNHQRTEVPRGVQNFSTKPQTAPQKLRHRGS